MKKHHENKLISLVLYLGFRFLIGIYGLIPARKAYDLGAGITSFFYRFFPGRRKVAIDNLLKTGVAKTKEEADRIAKIAFGHLAGHLCEAMKVGEIVTPENWKEHLQFEGPQETYDLLFNHPETPVIILTGHHGVWEAAGLIFSFSRHLIAVARKMNNPYIDRYLKKHHFRGSITVISKKRGFTPQVIREWKNSHAAMTLVMDQHANRKQGIVVDFMGRPALTHTSPARLHFASHAPVLVGSFIRLGPFSYKIITGAPIRFQTTGDKNADTHAFLTEVNRRLGDIIRQYPEQYLWAHKRWRM